MIQDAAAVPRRGQAGPRRGVPRPARGADHPADAAVHDRRAGGPGRRRRSDAGVAQLRPGLHPGRLRLRGGGRVHAAAERDVPPPVRHAAGRRHGSVRRRPGSSTRRGRPSTSCSSASGSRTPTKFLAPAPGTSGRRGRPPKPGLLAPEGASPAGATPAPASGCASSGCPGRGPATGCPARWRRSTRWRRPPGAPGAGIPPEILQQLAADADPTGCAAARPGRPPPARSSGPARAAARAEQLRRRWPADADDRRQPPRSEGCRRRCGGQPGL